MTARKPTALKILEGTNRRDRANPAEPQPPTGAKSPPWLPRSGPARSAWNRLAPILTDVRVLTMADAEALGLACMALADYLAAVDDSDGWRRADAAWKRYLAALRDFGLTPASRPKVSATPVQAVDPLEAWMASGSTSTPPVPPRPKRAKATTPPVDALEAWQRGDSPEVPA